MAKRQITLDFTTIVSDILYLSRKHFRYENKDLNTAGQYQLLAADYATFAKTKRLYDRIQLLDATGMEMIRVDSADGNIRIAPPEQLQFTGDSDYFVNSRSLGRGEVYMSHLDLNMKNGRVEFPLKPMIRFSIPLQDQTDAKAGILVVDYLAHTMLVALQSDASVFRGQLMVVDQDGYWLLGKTSEDEWGFVINERRYRNFSRDFPDAWSVIATNNQGRVTENGRLFTFDTVYPKKMVAALCRRQGAVLKSGSASAGLDQYQWKIVSELALPELHLDPIVHTTFGTVAGVLLLILSLWVSKLIDKRLRAETKLKKSEAGLAKAQEISSLGNWEWHPAEDRFFWSEQIYQIFGADPGTLTADRRNFMSLIHPEDRERLSACFDAALNTSTPYTIEHRIVRVDGVVRVLKNQGQPMTDETGRVKGLFGILQDITEQKRLEDAIRESEERLKAMSNASLDALVLVNGAGHTLFWNTAAEEMFGYTEAEVRDQDIHELIAPPEDRDAAREGLKHFAKTGQGKLIDSVIEFEAIRKDGSRFPVGRAVAAFEHNGQWFAIAGVRDITERKKTENDLTEANVKLRELGKLKDKFLGMAAHDMRNPLVSIRGFSEILSEGDLGPVTDQQLEFLGIIQKTAQEMLELINDLLDISVIESGKLDLNRNPENMKMLVEKRLHLIRTQAEKKQIEFQTNLEPVPDINIDAGRVAQIIDNLFSNAIKFSPAGATIWLHLSSDEHSIHFSVKDQGAGIPEDELTKLFSEFQRLTPQPTAGESSTGLGLSIAKKIATAHKGDITVESTEGVGSTFTLILPRKT